MSFLSTGVYTTFVANTKAKSAEVNANNAANVAFFNTSTSQIMVGQVWEKIGSTSGSNTLSSSQTIRTYLVAPSGSTDDIFVLPTASSSANMQLEFIWRDNTSTEAWTSGAYLKIEGDTATANFGHLGSTIYLANPGDRASFHCDGTRWHVKNISEMTTRLGEISAQTNIKHAVCITTASLNFDLQVARYGDVFSLLNRTDTSTQMRFSNTIASAPLNGSYVEAKCISRGASAASDFAIINRFDPFDNHKYLYSTAASHSLTSSDLVRTLLVNVNTSAGYTVTLPTAAASAHRLLTIKNVGATTGVLTIDGSGAETIDATASIALSPFNAAATVQCDGTSWYTIGVVHAVTTYFTTFTFSGGSGGTTATTTGYLERTGNFVNLLITVGNATTAPTTTSFALAADTAIPVGFRPAASVVMTSAPAIVNAVYQATPAAVTVNSSGTISIYRDYTQILNWGVSTPNSGCDGWAIMLRYRAA